jgi:hypothetical protein
MKHILCLALLCASFLVPLAATADGPPQFAALPKLSLHPATATGWQVNLRTGDLDRVALLLGVEATYDVGINLGAGLYCGAGIAGSSPNAAQCDLLVSVARYGAVGFGSQVFKDNGRAVYQGLAFVGLTLPGTPF